MLGKPLRTLGGADMALGQGKPSQPSITLPPGQGNGAVSPSPWLMLGKPLGRLGGPYIAFGQGKPSQPLSTLPPGQGNGAASPSAWLMLGKPLGTFGGAYIAFGQDNPSQLFNTLPPGQGSSHMLGTQLGETLPAGGPCMEFKQPGKPWLLGSTSCELCSKQ